MTRESYHHGGLKVAALDLPGRLIEAEPAFSLRALAELLPIAGLSDSPAQRR